MFDIALRIKLQDWIYILLIGIVLGILLSSFGYVLLDVSWLQGAYFGLLLGFLITLFSLTFITFMNRVLLPRLPKQYWLPVAMLFSWFSGFSGSYLSINLTRIFEIELIPLFDSHALYVSISIGLLTYIVGALLYRFVKIRNEKEEVDHHYLHSRLSSLETQLNPHFMFNALNSIAELIHQDPIKAEEAVLKVSSFLRNTMGEKALISLKQELKNVQDYIELENIRFSNAIELTFKKAPPAWMVPKFSIQLLAENAIKHGFTPKQEHLKIELDFDESSQDIIISNDGKAMHSTVFGIGLDNLDQRLQLLCKGKLLILQTDRPTFKIHLGECHENTYR